MKKKLKIEHQILHIRKTYMRKILKSNWYLNFKNGKKLEKKSQKSMYQ